MISFGYLRLSDFAFKMSDCFRLLIVYLPLDLCSDNKVPLDNLCPDFFIYFIH